MLPNCSVHYQRIHPDYWRDRLLRVKAMGLNAIQVTVHFAFQNHCVESPFDFEAFYIY